MPRRWLHSAPFDLGLIVGPPLLAALAALALARAPGAETPPWAWLLLVVGVDVAHVYASLYRVYWDPEEFRRRRALYVNVPLACWAAGVLLYRHSPLAFWRVLAYVAVFHFVRQQYGFLRVYQRLHGRPGRLDSALDAACIYSTMLYPLVFWHADGARTFQWFVEGDFLRLPRGLASPAAWAYGAVLAAFGARQVRLALSGAGVNWGKLGVVASTAAAWYVGIVLLNSDLAFTVTNVVAHGVPYAALVWLYGRRRWAQDSSWRGLAHRPAAAALFALPLLALAYLEEGLWDLLVWREHAALFGGLSLPWELPPGALALVVPLLALPQATHYVLDAWIWRFDGSNPGLRGYLLGLPH